jgi:hypothetical protein
MECNNGKVVVTLFTSSSHTLIGGNPLTVPREGILIIFFLVKSYLNSLVVTKLLHLVIIKLSDNLIAFLASVRIGLALLLARVLVGEDSLKSGRASEFDK